MENPPFEDVFPIENGDFAMSYKSSGVQFFLKGFLVPFFKWWGLWIGKTLATPKTGKMIHKNPSNIEWDLTNGPLSKLLELLGFFGVRSKWVLLEIFWKEASSKISSLAGP